MIAFTPKTFTRRTPKASSSCVSANSVKEVDSSTGTPAKSISTNETRRKQNTGGLRSVVPDAISAHWQPALLGA